MGMCDCPLRRASSAFASFADRSLSWYRSDSRCRWPPGVESIAGTLARREGWSVPPSSARNAAPTAAQAADTARIILRARIRRPAGAVSRGGAACSEPGTASNVHSLPIGARSRFPNILGIRGIDFSQPRREAARK